MHISSITDFDSKRKKISLDDGRLIFLLYKGECAKLRLKAGTELSCEEYQKICDDILKPRIKKRALYFLKSADKTEKEVRQKLRSALYPDELIDFAMEFLKSYAFVDDRRYAENLIEAKRGKASKREIIQKLRQKGVAPELLSELSEEISSEDEYDICKKTLERYMRGKDLRDKKDRMRAWRYLMSKGYQSEAINEAFSVLELSMEDEFDF